MKKFFLLFAVVFMLVPTLTFSQVKMTDNEVYQTVLRSKEINRVMEGITDPARIYPGQELIFMFTDGNVGRIVVEKGDNQWKIVKNKLAQMEFLHGPVVDSLKPDSTSSVISAPAKKEHKFPWGSAIGFLVLIGVLLALKDYFKPKDKPEDKNVDPTKEGEPFVAGGVKKEDAENHFRTLHNKTSNIVVKDIRAGFLNTASGIPQIVDFADGTHKSLCFRNVPGYAGMVSLDNGKTFHEEYFLEGCGNPVHQRKSFKGGLIFSLSPIDFGGEHDVTPYLESESEHEFVDEKIKKTPVQEVTTEASSPAVTKSDLVSVSSEYVALAQEFLDKQIAHRVTMKFTNEQGTVETIFETKNDAVKK